MKQLLLDIQPIATPTLESFIVGRNAEALHNLHQAVSGVAAARFIYLWGEAGSGKSHLLKAAASAGAMIADDVHMLASDAQIALFDTYNRIKAESGILITAGLYPPLQMGLRDDLATRLAWGLVYKLYPLTDEEKAQALKTHANARGMRLPDEVVDYCLRYLQRDLPTLMAVLNALDEWSLIEQKKITIPLLKKLIAQHLIY